MNTSKDAPANIAVFASGSGTNAESLMRHFQDHPLAEIRLILSNKKEAYVLERARQYNIPAHVFSKEDLYQNNRVASLLKEYNINYILMAGFLWLIPEYLINLYANKILNIHPALLPKYGGKGMYGKNVHKAVIENNETQSGITIHIAGKNYDEGAVLLQKACPVYQDDTPDTLASRIHELEHYYYPRVVEKFISGKPITFHEASENT